MTTPALPALLSMGGIPNSLIRSALFSTKKLGNDREHNRNVQIIAQSGYEISYSGEELNQYDCQVLYAVFHLQKQSGLMFGESVTVVQNDIIELTGRKAGGSAYEPIYQSMRRLCESTIRITQQAGPTQRIYHGHIVDRFHKDDRGHLAFTLNPDLVSMFASDCTIISLKRKVQLTRLISKWLFDYCSSHQSYLPLPLEYLMGMSGYPNGKSEFVRQLKLSCAEILDVLGEDAPFVQFEVKNNRLALYRKQHKRDCIQTAPRNSSTLNQDADGWIDPFAK
jgi:hypothetical protein